MTEREKVAGPLKRNATGPKEKVAEPSSEEAEEEKNRMT
jgi:hypothetical protein